MQDAAAAATRAVGLMALAETQKGTVVFRAPTGRYRRTIHLVPITKFRSEVRPGNLPYIRWIEGTSRRNATSRFKGYRLFQKAQARVRLRTPETVRQAMRPYLDRLGAR